ncbi:hypothetical protein SAMN05216567_13619 [Variovorax sp. OK605]|nr:hypothetical protein SAMN05216567_13619 [Variovorax sp. OK605]
MNPYRRLMLGLLSGAAIALLLSCGGGSEAGNAISLGLGASGTPSAAVGADAPAGNGTGTSGTSSGSTSSDAGGDTSTASNGSGSTDGSGVGSGGTGVSADAAGIGSADGLGSVILNGLRYNTDTATFSVEDATDFQIGMSARVVGKVDADFTSGVATQVVSAAELRGAASAIDLAAGTFVVMGTTVSIDSATVWGDGNGLGDVTAGNIAQVWGLPSAPGSLRATRVQVAPALVDPLVTGTVQSLDTLSKTFMLGQLKVNYNAATFTGIDAPSLANGLIVRARGVAPPVANMLAATKVQGWYAIPVSDGIAVQLAGVITDFTSRGAFKVLGAPVNANDAQITGGPAGSLGNGVKVEVDGSLSSGVLVVKKLRIRNVPGTGGPASFTLIGTIGAYQSPASFRVRGQPVDASGPGVIFENGTAANLSDGKHVTVVGDRVLDGVLIAQRLTFASP